MTKIVMQFATCLLFITQELSSYLFTGDQTYTQREANDNHFSLSDFARHLPRRSIYNRDARYRFTVRTCSMHLVADHKLYEEIYNNEGRKDDKRTRDEIKSLLNSHVQAVNEIYESIDFNGVRGINFEVKRISIITPDECELGKQTGPLENLLCENHLDASEYLARHSASNHSSFCLSYAITYRDFADKLGLAWAAINQLGSIAGVCHVYQRGKDGYRSLNTGIITLSSYGKRVSPRVSQLTLAHEIGHNLGAQHDCSAGCLPGSVEGNFIMHPASSPGDRPNNDDFSTCSLANISAVLDTLLRLPPSRHLGTESGMRRNCFQESSTPFCGNGIPETGEQCDCGFTDKDCNMAGDKCCNPAEGARRYNGCTRKPGAACSPSEGVCCNANNCQFHISGGGKECQAETECSYRSTCDGFGAKCPAAIPKADGLACEDATKVCRKGACVGSVCEQVGLKDCTLTEGTADALCYLACMKDGVCTSSQDLPEFAANRTILLQKEFPDQSGILLQPGTLCNNSTGRCDTSRQCRPIANAPSTWLQSMQEYASSFIVGVKSFFSF